MAIKDKTWAIVDMNTRGKPIFLDYTCARTRKRCIENFVEHNSELGEITWENLKKRGYRCYRFNVSTDSL